MIVKPLHHFYTAFSFSLLLLFLTACGGGSEQKKQQSGDTKSEIKKNIKRILNEVPKPSEIPYLLQQTGADFNEKLINDPGSVEKYKTTNNAAALNLGIYAADIGYVSVYEKAQDAIKYVTASKQLADKLQIASIFEPAAVKRFESNLKNKDSLVYLIDESIKSADKYLKDNERNTIAAMVFTGTFIEGLFIATEIVATYPSDLPADVKNMVLIPLVRVILKQEKPLEDLIKVLQSLEIEPDINDLVKSLQDLHKLYKALNIDEKIQKNQGELILTDQTIQSITKKVKEIRTNIIK